MTQEMSVNEIFERAIEAEHTAEGLYQTLARLFAHHASVAEFWTHYAEEEHEHLEWLTATRERLPAETLEAGVEPEIVERFERMARQHATLGARLYGVRTLEDAYQLCHELENSETNAIFEFLIRRFAQDEATRDFLRSQLVDHISRLVFDFPVAYGDASIRRKVPAQR